MNTCFHRGSWALLAALCFAAFGCSDDPLKCGAGTILQDGKCVVDPGATTCGAGTVLVEGSCVADPDVVEPKDDVVASDTTGADAGGDTVSDAVLSDAAGPDGDASAAADSGPGADLPDAVTGIVCLPHCVGKTCGSDGCGGSCGTCSSSATPSCDPVLGVCVAKCEPACDGKTCGTDGCGGVCGSCADKMTCDSSSRCIPSTWTCEAAQYDDGAVCHCGCGAVDEDCTNKKLQVLGCAVGHTCDKAGLCVSAVPSTWTCSALSYADGNQCNCGCGALDPDCANPALPVTGCASGTTCQKDGTCPACTPQCAGKECGDDGCGGQCGVCSDAKKSACVAGTCSDSCKPKPTLCAVNKCGADGCGGSCGTCDKGFKCVVGACEAIPKPVDPTSCDGHCGDHAPAGCHCDAGCVATKTCCADYQTACTCTPNCSGKTCGDDGCGGSCGTCAGATPYCGDDGKCTKTCVPFCNGKSCGTDGCGGSCGSCGKDAACADNGQCVPSAWHCNVDAYADKAGCDCGCGAVDPDCKDSNAIVFGCPTAKTKCASSGVCDLTFCSADSACKAGMVCSGSYYKAAARYAGSCAAPLNGGNALGEGCLVNAGCASRLCVLGKCAAHCSKDTDCPGGLTCLAAGISGGKALGITGFVGACRQVVGTAKPCSKQADCATNKETCVAFIDATTLKPRYLCSSPANATKMGDPCPSDGCGAGLFCVGSAKGPVCTQPCPGSTSDCPTGWTCGSTTLHNAGTPLDTDDEKVAVCVAK